MTEDRPLFKLSEEDTKRLREAAAHIAAVTSQAWEAVIAAMEILYRQFGMTDDETEQAINEAIEKAQEAERISRQIRQYRPPRRPQKAAPAACKSIHYKPCSKRPVARSSIRQRGDRKRG